MSSQHDLVLAADKIERFQGQAELFLEKCMTALGLDRLADFKPITTQPTRPLRPVLVEDFRRLTTETRARIRTDYYGRDGVAYLIVLNPSGVPGNQHPLLDIASQLRDDLGLYYPITHPMEGHPEAVARFGATDGTLKLYDLSVRDGSTGYREQAETAEMFASHNDGLGYGGVVQTAFFYLDSAPLCGGYTYFQNVMLLALELAQNDYAAYRSLFLPDAITALRPRGKGAIKVTCPVLYLNEDEHPQVFFRVSSGEYIISCADNDALKRAMKFLNAYTKPFAYGSTFAHFTEKGHACIIRNQAVVHGRTDFIDGIEGQRRRCLARKWFATAARHAHYKHVPSIHMSKTYAAIFPDRFGEKYLEGEWHYENEESGNVRIR